MKNSSGISSPDALRGAKGVHTLLQPLYYVSMEMGNPFKGFSLLCAIDASYHLWDRVRKLGPHLYIYVANEVLDSSLRYARFDIEPFLHEVLRMSHRSTKALIVFSGDAKSNQKTTHLTVLVARDGRLLSASEKSIGGTQTQSHVEELRRVVQAVEIEYPTINVTYAGIELVPTIEPAQWLEKRHVMRGRRRRLIAHEERKITQGRAWLFPFAAGLLVAGGATGMGYSRYLDSQTNFLTAVDGPSVKTQGGINIEQIKLLEVRSKYLSRERRQDRSAKELARIIKSIAEIEGAKLISISLPTSETVSAGTGTDVVMELSVPKSRKSAIEQGEALLSRVAELTGMSVELGQQGWNEANGRRKFVVKGALK